MTPDLFKYLLTGAYAGAVMWLSWVGMRKTNDAASFAIGRGDMNPYLIGITLAASISSTATFVINPGFVYVHGLSAYIHYAVAGSLGILAAFLLLTRRFLRLGRSGAALTIPGWIYARYQHGGLRLLFALLNLMSIAFVVLILVGCSYLVTGLFPVSQKVALLGVLLFVFSYVLLGGTYAHAYTNSLQGVMMLVIVLLLTLHGWHYLGAAPLENLRTIGAGYASAWNPESGLYFSFFSVFVSGFVVTFALMLQPHILTKVLYLKSERDIGRFVATTVIAGVAFSLMLLVGFYARLSGLEVAQQDIVVREYLLASFSGTVFGEYVLVLIFISLLAAGMSTLDGILVALAAMVVNDLVKPLGGSGRHGLAWSRLVLVAVGLVSVALAWNPPPLIGLFAQQGVYGLAAASLVPILFGTLLERPPPVWIAGGAAVLGLACYLLLNFAAGIANPAISATWAILLAATAAALALVLQRWRPVSVVDSPTS
jgi:sodium/pantothenate symporter